MLVWNGERVYDQVLLAAERAGNSILSDCVIEAKQRVPVVTSLLQGSIQMRPMRMVSENTIAGLFGSFQIKYAPFVELGTGPHDILPVRKKALYWKGAPHPFARVHHPGTKARPFLRPAADKFFPQFAERIRREIG